MLALELKKNGIKKCKRRKIYARFKDNIWAVLAETCLVRKQIKLLGFYYVS